MIKPTWLDLREHVLGRLIKELFDWNHIVEKFEYQLNEFALKLTVAGQSLKHLDQGNNMNNNVFVQDYFGSNESDGCLGKKDRNRENFYQADKIDCVLRICSKEVAAESEEKA